MQPEVWETEYADYWLEDGIMHIVYAANLIITLEVAKQMVEDRVKFSNGVAMPLLVDIRGLASVDTLSRKYYTTARALENVSAGALLVGSLISRLAGNIYLTVDKPALPAKLFTDRNKALNWLKKFKK